MERLTISPLAFFELIVQPQFADVLPDGPFNGTLHEFTVMDDVTSKRPILDVLGSANILRRRDASCNIIWSPVAKITKRSIEVEKVYGATKNCENEFYTGCFEDFRAQSQKFRDYIMVFFNKAIKTDITSNAYFGDIARADDPTGIWSWNTFDGIFKKYANYFADGIIPMNRLINIVNPVDYNVAFNLLKQMFDTQDELMTSMPEEMKAFYVTRDIFNAYQEYKERTSGGFNPQLYSNGIPQLYYRGIQLLPEPVWGPVLTALNGGVAASAAILTFRGNFVFGTDKNYGGGPMGDEALSVWFSYDEQTWKYLTNAKFGVEIAVPVLSIMAITNINLVNY